MINSSLTYDLMTLYVVSIALRYIVLKWEQPSSTDATCSDTTFINWNKNHVHYLIRGVKRRSYIRIVGRKLSK